MEETTAEIKPVIPTEIKTELKDLLPLQKWGNRIGGWCTILGVIGIIGTIIYGMSEINANFGLENLLYGILGSVFTIIGGRLFKRIMYFFAVLENKALND